MLYGINHLILPLWSHSLAEGVQGDRQGPPRLLVWTHDPALNGRVEWREVFENDEKQAYLDHVHLNGIMTDFLLWVMEGDRVSP